MDAIRPGRGVLKLILAIAFITGFVAIGVVVTDLVSDEGCGGG